MLFYYLCLANITKKKVMNYKNIANKYFAAVLLFASSILFSCNEETNCTAIITVQDTNGNPVYQAEVWLHQNNQISPQGTISNLSDFKTTDVNGKTVHVFDLEAVLNIEVYSKSGNDTLTGTNVIRLLKGKTVNKTVEIN